MSNHFKKVSAFSTTVIVSSLLITTFASAQTATSTDGSNDTSNQRREYIRNWRGQSNEMQNKVNALGSTITTSVLMPVLFGIETSNLKSDFGDARSGGRTHLGNDIMAVSGTPIVSPTAAVVLRFGVGSGEGNYVYTANPGGETFVYMHLDRFAEGLAQGQVLEKGSLIGYVGNTGNASGGAAHLHFEIHDSNNTAIDPYPRLTGIFSIQEKIQYLTRILSTSSDMNTLAQLLVANFRSTFNQATSMGVTLPDVIRNYMSSLPATAPTPGSNLPSGDLQLGSKGGDVIKLQTYLMLKNTGPAAARLSQAGATGNFGAMTQSALVEYQISMGISPADGYYGGVTRQRIESTPIATTPTTPLPTTPTTPNPTTPSTGGTVLLRDLTLNSVGEDVRTLQKFLNARGYTVALSGAGSVGMETTYFGPATRAAVILFQIGKGITPAVGYVGKITRAAISNN